MKKLSLLLLLLLPLSIFAQAPTPLDLTNINPENIFNTLVEPIYGALVIIFGYLSAWIPGVNKLNTYARVLAFGLVAGLGFHLFGGASIWKVGLSFLLSTGLIYDGFLRPLQGIFLKKSPSKG